MIGHRDILAVIQMANQGVVITTKPTQPVAHCVVFEFPSRLLCIIVWEPLRVYDWNTLCHTVQVLVLNVLARPSNPLAAAQP